ncbi:uncharacterized protein EURHEDRAFT_147510 [Aspergillus ruber CBS 135680]|uniref:Uncharacterized protein n=1 Tax=Aspergillus ruber (strain CBS 135680) TaxID=1388766 RepID=A0A017S9E6_ASPRC|nr:uncharacterized protein EURHEDRAFT_147510 [Aspergillus ruber CBS 135680]EYE93441.1 hypothetical protein EURHEDRAFT_147510 [Aspergillus ruber CBS 135680]
MVILLYLYFHPLDLTSISLTARLTLSGGVRSISECDLYSSPSRLSRKSHFLFLFFLTLPFFPYFPFISTLFSHLLLLFFFSLSHSHSTHHPPTHRCSLSFVSFSPCENYLPPYYHFIVLYYYLLLLPFFFFFLH